MRMQGFSLLEVLIVLFLIALIGSFGVPFGSNWYQTQVCFIMTQDIKQAIHQAIEDATRLNEPLKLMPIMNENWSSGLVLRVERTSNQHHQWQWKASGYQVHWHGFQSKDYLRFAPDLNQSALNGYFMIENQAHHGMKIIINRLGRVRTETL
ncbi:MAG: hypothetical protein CK424_08120 [Legionella sp.]|nr:MAG: hypothetical protein CK424_08120 [Legionella sp.]